MIKVKYLLPVSFLFLTGCKDSNLKQEKTIQNPQTHFSYFEISYSSGWGEGFSFLADSNKIFFSPSPNPQGISDSVKYGILPGSISQLIDSTIQLIAIDTTGRSKVINCDDCTVIAIKAITGDHPIDFFQSGEINPTVSVLIHKLEIFLDSSKHTTINALMIPGTASTLMPPPPPIIKPK